MEHSLRQTTFLAAKHTLTNSKEEKSYKIRTYSVIKLEANRKLAENSKNVEIEQYTSKQHMAQRRSLKKN